MKTFQLKVFAKNTNKMGNRFKIILWLETKLADISELSETTLCHEPSPLPSIIHIIFLNAGTVRMTTV